MHTHSLHTFNGSINVNSVSQIWSGTVRDQLFTYGSCYKFILCDEVIRFTSWILKFWKRLNRNMSEQYRAHVCASFSPVLHSLNVLLDSIHLSWAFNKTFDISKAGLFCAYNTIRVHCTFIIIIHRTTAILYFEKYFYWWLIRLNYAIVESVCVYAVLKRSSYTLKENMSKMSE